MKELKEEINRNVVESKQSIMETLIVVMSKMLKGKEIDPVEKYFMGNEVNDNLGNKDSAGIFGKGYSLFQRNWE